MKARRILEQVPAAMCHPAARDEARRCHATINLDGATYRCAREHVDGIHDANARHKDGGLVRW